MKSKQQNRFSSAQGSDYHGGANSAAPNMMSSNARLDMPFALIFWLLRKLLILLDRIFVILKYQFYKNTAVAPGSLKAPLLKLTVAAGIAYMILNGNLSLSLDSTNAQRAQANHDFFAEKVVMQERSDKEGSLSGSLAAIFHKTDYFADLPEDDAETRRVKAYIRRFKDVAVQEKEKYGIPASIKMAQAILESDAGGSQLSRTTNNHFGIKCFSRTCKKGHCSNFGDDTHKDFFRKYGSAWESWRSHSNLLINGKYKSLLRHGDDYEKWAKGLKKLGYATAGRYDEKLIGLIERYHLDELDK